MAALVFKPGQENRLLSGHPWIYKTEIEEIKGRFDEGDVVELLDARKRFLGVGYINTRSQITARLLTTARRSVNREFFRERLEAAAAMRQKVVVDTNAFRLVYSESDLLPGLIVDRYGDYLAVQFLTLGMERWKELILDLLETLFRPTGIVERSDVTVRAHEGLPMTSGIVRGTCPEQVTIRESGIAYRVDVIGGHKTGFFLDQRENRAVVRRLADGARVLDGCCHTGGFSLAAAAGGAAEVIGVDNAADALDMARQNAALNGMADRCRFEEGNIFDLLRAYQQEPPFDLVILDPPAFTRGKSSLPGATRGYKDINLNAMRLLKPGGFLITCSCSYHMTDDLFRDVLLQAASDVHRTARVLEFRGQAPDHPTLLAAPETHYLKCVVLQIL
ncbi:MAG: class I SAM-dependent rRNA methyltransferase [candidate division Zixibacteria bacterium]|nr:class I SAM-dependent rRNA methyltransferase [candidate division Zixibacteria bacterium]